MKARDRPRAPGRAGSGAAPAGARWSMVATRALQVVVAVCVVVLVWFVGFRRSSEPPPVATPGVVVGASPEAEVLATTDVGPLQVVELQGPPNHRVMELDTASGESSTTLPLTEETAVYSMAQSPSGDQLALAYTVDTWSIGNGVYVLDLGGGPAEPVPLVPETEGVLYTDLSYSPDGSTLWATAAELDRGDELLSVVSIDPGDGEVSTAVDNAVDPAPGDGWVAYLPVAPDGARRSIVQHHPATGETLEYRVLDGSHDLDHLLHDPTGGRLLAAALLEPDEPAITVGGPAGAHGNHLVPSQWLTIDLITGRVAGPLPSEPAVVWDSTVLSGGVLAFTTGDGLVVLDESPTMLVASRALRMIAG